MTFIRVLVAWCIGVSLVKRINGYPEVPPGSLEDYCDSFETDGEYTWCKFRYNGLLTRAFGGAIQDSGELIAGLESKDYPPVEMIYPNLRCHPNYNFNRSDPKEGEGYLLEGYNFCLYEKAGGPNKPPECLKICMAEYVGLIDTRWQNNIRVRWNPFNDMVNYVRHLLVNYDTRSGRQIVTNILDKCRDHIKLVERSRTNPCHTSKWRDFFICLDSVWDCNNMTGEILLDY